MARLLVTCNYIADDKTKDGYYERALLYTLSSDQGRNHEEMLLAAARSPSALREFLFCGGQQTLASFPLASGLCGVADTEVVPFPLSRCVHFSRRGPKVAERTYTR